MPQRKEIQLPLEPERATATQPIPIRRETFRTLGIGGNDPAPVTSTPRKKIEKIPLDVAFREILGFVTKALNEHGEQWNGDARQDLVSTVLIAATKAGYTTIWNREDAA
jgi:hypothetical protein